MHLLLINPLVINLLTIEGHRGHYVFDGRQRILLYGIKVQMFILRIFYEKGKSDILVWHPMSVLGFFQANDSYNTLKVNNNDQSILLGLTFERPLFLLRPTNKRPSRFLSSQFLAWFLKKNLLSLGNIIFISIYT